MALKLINGKFFEGDKEVPLEFGNKEQIDLIQKVQDAVDNGFEVQAEEEITYSAHFPCLNCHKIVVLGSAVELTDFIGKVKSCSNCKAKYEVIEDEENEFVYGLRVKVIKLHP